LPNIRQGAGSIPAPITTMKEQKKRGGARPGAGRKKGSGKGRTVVSKSIALPLAMWAEIDRHRGSLSRGRWLMRVLS